MSHKITVEAKQQDQHASQPKAQEIYINDEVPLISLRGYAISPEDTAAKMQKAQRSLDEARQQIVLCK